MNALAIDDEQKALWNGTAGHAWVAAQEALDRMFEPLERLLADEAALKPRARVLDVGCGTGSTTLAVQQRLGAASQCVGVDISEPMLERARARARHDGASATFVCADAALHPFEPASFDLIFSRFGVMFFADPVRAFQNLRRAARQDADLRLLVWRSPAENPFMTAAERAAADILPNLPPREPDAPGQFAFADAERVRRILHDAGWANLDVAPLDVACAFSQADLQRYVTLMGPVGRSLREADEATRARTLAAVLHAFAPYVEGGVVRFQAACWWVRADARGAG